MLSLQGVPGIYFHNLPATKNHLPGVTKTGQKRAINRKQWQLQELEDHLADSHGITHYVLKRYKQVLQIRKKHPAFSPQSLQEVLDFGHSFFAFRRSSGKETIICISNITHTHQLA